MDNNTIYLIVNVVLVLVLALNIFRSFKKGLILSLWDALGTLFALVVGWWLANIVAEFIRIYPMDWTPLNNTQYAVLVNQIFNIYSWTLVLFILIRIIMFFFTPLVKKIRTIPGLKQVDHLLGSVFGVVVTWLWALLAIFFFSIPLYEDGDAVIENTMLSVVYDTSFEMIVESSELLSESDLIARLLNQEELSPEDQARIDSLMQTYDIDSDWTEE